MGFSLLVVFLLELSLLAACVASPHGLQIVKSARTDCNLLQWSSQKCTVTVQLVPEVAESFKDFHCFVSVGHPLYITPGNDYPILHPKLKIDMDGSAIEYNSGAQYLGDLERLGNPGVYIECYPLRQHRLSIDDIVLFDSFEVEVRSIISPLLVLVGLAAHLVPLVSDVTIATFGALGFKRLGHTHFRATLPILLCLLRRVGFVIFLMEAFDRAQLLYVFLPLLLIFSMYFFNVAVLVALRLHWALQKAVLYLFGEEEARLRFFNLKLAGDENVSAEDSEGESNQRAAWPLAFFVTLFTGDAEIGVEASFIARKLDDNPNYHRWIRAALNAGNSHPSWIALIFGNFAMNLANAVIPIWYCYSHASSLLIFVAASGVGEIVCSASSAAKMFLTAYKESRV